MRTRHPAHAKRPSAWLITDPRLGPGMLRQIARLPRRTGVLVRHHHLAPGARARLLRAIRRIARQRALLVIDEAVGTAARVHDPREIARARLGGAKLLLVSPVFATRSHPQWAALPRMRAAALVRLCSGQAVALGGMDAARFAQVRWLGFTGWAGIDGWDAGATPLILTSGRVKSKTRPGGRART
jgi:thiamine-phosphate pyrophosphorylase